MTPIVIDTDTKAPIAVGARGREASRPLLQFEVNAAHERWRIRGGDGVMPDIVHGEALPAQTLIAIGEAVAQHYRERGWKLPRGA